MIKREMSFGTRVASMLLDHIAMTFAIMFIALPITITDIGEGFGEETSTTPFYANYIFYVMAFAMSLYFNKDIIQGKSIAKRATRTEVVNIKTNKVASPIKCLVRNITIMVWPIEVIAVLINPSRRIGDFIAGTKVDYLTDERDHKPSVSFKQVIISVIIGYIIILVGSFLVKGIFNNSVFDYPDYVETSFNKELSSSIENHLDSVRSDYLLDTHIKVYDEITGDSIKYISALFYLKENYIEPYSGFNKIEAKVLNSMYEIVPKKDFILKGKFIYNSKYVKQSTMRIYDWRQSYETKH